MRRWVRLTSHTRDIGPREYDAGPRRDVQSGATQIRVAPALALQVLRYAEGGEVTGTVETSQPVFACAVGGADGRTLFAMTAPDSDPAQVDGQRLGRIEVARI